MSNPLRDAVTRYLRNDYLEVQDDERIAELLKREDTIALANAYVAGHREDDDEPVNEEWWLEEFDSHFVGYPLEWFVYLDGNSVGMHVEVNDGSEVYRAKIQHVKTRGDVRNLVRLLFGKVKA